MCWHWHTAVTSSRLELSEVEEREMFEPFQGSQDLQTWRAFVNLCRLMKGSADSSPTRLLESWRVWNYHDRVVFSKGEFQDKPSDALGFMMLQ